MTQANTQEMTPDTEYDDEGEPCSPSFNEGSKAAYYLWHNFRAQPKWVNDHRLGVYKIPHTFKDPSAVKAFDGYLNGIRDYFRMAEPASVREPFSVYYSRPRWRLYVFFTSDLDLFQAHYLKKTGEQLIEIY